MSAGHLTFDYVVSDAFVERAIQRLQGRSQAPNRLQALRARPGVGDRRAWMKRADHEHAGDEESLVTCLVAKGKNGDTSAMETLIERYQARVAGFVFACVSDGQAVEDLCQTIFYKMLLGLPRLETVGKFESWLFRIARNACFDHLRRRRLRAIFLPWKDADDRFESTPDHMLDPAADRRADTLRRALMKLPKKQRELVTLLQDDRLSYEKLAEITNSSVGSVKARLFRARRQLRKYMKDDF
jgi:RNA polymerase sigma-70 factor (ECF subfamily)